MTIRFIRDERGGFGSPLDVTEIPCSAILAGTVGNLWVVTDGQTDRRTDGKTDRRNE